VSQIAISGDRPTSVAVEPTIISWAPPIRACCICVSEPSEALPMARTFILPPLAFSTSLANMRTARPWLESSTRP
jgi:hypothetical protein